MSIQRGELRAFIANLGGKYCSFCGLPFLANGLRLHVPTNRPSRPRLLTRSTTNFFKNDRRKPRELLLQCQGWRSHRPSLQHRKRLQLQLQQQKWQRQGVPTRQKLTSRHTGQSVAQCRQESCRCGKHTLAVCCCSSRLHARTTIVTGTLLDFSRLPNCPRNVGVDRREYAHFTDVLQGRGSTTTSKCPGSALPA